MKPFDKLSSEENKELLKFPAFISLLAANNDGTLDDVQKKSAIKSRIPKPSPVIRCLMNFTGRQIKSLKVI
ncbi:MAG: hypothetical protein Q8M08_09975 [Bacteroidales bacterium]|nr:hypothetical protein [Bacteroidales bacterium]